MRAFDIWNFKNKKGLFWIVTAESTDDAKSPHLLVFSMALKGQRLCELQRPAGGVVKSQGYFI